MNFTYFHKVPFVCTTMLEPLASELAHVDACSLLAEPTGTAPLVGCLEVEEVDPPGPPLEAFRRPFGGLSRGKAHVAGQLLASHHGHGLVAAARVLLRGPLGEHGGPQQRGAPAGPHGEVQGRKARLAALLHVREVEEEGVDPGAAGVVVVLLGVHVVMLNIALAQAILPSSRLTS